MVSSGPPRPSARWSRSLVRRRAAAIPLSIALHLAVLYALARVSWIAPEVGGRSTPTVVWLEPQRVRPRAENMAVPRMELPPSSDPVEPLPERVPRDPTERAEVERAAPPPSERLDEVASDEPREDVETQRRPADPGTRASPREDRAREPAPLAPDIDWENERRRAAASVIEQRARDEAYRTFSLEDLDEPGAAEERDIAPSAVAEAMSDNCEVVTSKLARFAWQMVGRCTRAPRGDLFADLKPAHLQKRPVCAESEPERPLLAAAARERGISTVKCELMAEDQ